MTLRNDGQYSYGDDHKDIHQALRDYAESNGYPLDNVDDCRCECGAVRFELHVDETQGVGGRICVDCGKQHVMADGGHYIDEAELEVCECVCDGVHFELSAGVSRYRTGNDELTDDVRWFYIGCRCPNCDLVGCYADWKNEFNGYAELMQNI